MQTVDEEEIETIHLYVVREEEARPSCCLLSSQLWLSLSSYRFVLFLPISSRKNDLPFDFRLSSSLRNHLRPQFTSFRQE